MRLLILVGCFAAGVVLNFLAHRFGLGPWRKAGDAHWTERARLLWPVRVTAASNVLILPVLAHQIHVWIWPEAQAWWVSCMFAGCLGALLGNFPLEREIFPRAMFRSWLSITLGWWGIRLGGWASLVAAIVLMPSSWSWQMILVTGGYVLFNLCLISGAATRLLRLAGCLSPPCPDLAHRIHDEASHRGIALRRVWIMRGEAALAFAFPVQKEIVISQRLLEVCDEPEAMAICAHELAHLNESRLAVCGRLLSSYAFMPMIFLTPAIHGFGFLGLLPLLLLIFLLRRFSQKLSVALEQRADALAAASQSADGVYARALEKLYEFNQLPAVSSKNSRTHPHLYDRLIAAGVTPSYPRPEPAKGMSWIGRLYLWGTCILLGISIGRLVFHNDGAPPHAPQPQRVEGMSAAPTQQV